jgi:hypothetical protein
VIDRLAAADVDDPPVAEERPRRRQGRAEHDPAGRDRRSGQPEAQAGGGVGGAGAEVVMIAAGALGEGGEAGRGHDVHDRVGRGGQQPVYSEIVQRDHGGSGDLRREPGFGRGDA